MENKVQKFIDQMNRFSGLGYFKEKFTEDNKRDKEFTLLLNALKVIRKDIVDLKGNTKKRIKDSNSKKEC